MLLLDSDIPDIQPIYPPSTTTIADDVKSHGAAVVSVLRAIAPRSDIQSIAVTASSKNNRVRAHELLAGIDAAIGILE